tara:strand:+ start:962 stop:1345 length:384 start_codon:yes stop_codon:yes gene_type:complete
MLTTHFGVEMSGVIGSRWRRTTSQFAQIPTIRPASIPATRVVMKTRAKIAKSDFLTTQNLIASAISMSLITAVMTIAESVTFGMKYMTWVRVRRTIPTMHAARAPETGDDAPVSAFTAVRENEPVTL